MAVAGTLVAGCYTFQPVTGAVPDVGKQVAFDINDAGRVALGRAMGPEIGQVEGTLLEKDNGSYLLAVSTVRLLRGAGEQVWSGEQIRLQAEHVGPAYERRFSTGRSIGLGAVFVGAFTGFMLTRSLIGLGQEGSDGDDPPPATPAWVVPEIDSSVWHLNLYGVRDAAHFQAFDVLPRCRHRHRV